jgi:tRNA 2-thiouridine synthesizing protein C
MERSICVLVRKPPYGTEDAFAGLRLALALIANAIETKVVLLDDGVFNCVKGQNSEKIEMPSNIEVLQDLLGLDVKILCVREHLKVRGIDDKDIIQDMTMIQENELSEIIQSCDAVTSF